jgi:4-hydroxybenzoate polyprenyltransferase
MSTLVRQRLTRRAAGLIAVLGLLAAGSLALLPAPLAAVSGCFGRGTTTIYFSDASRTTVVGRFTSSCSGVCTGSGQVTSFFEIATTQCFPGGGGTD